jgi:4-amino-4-deoxy-L-arabinose transferase-like glycosyltransferase
MSFPKPAASLRSDIAALMGFAAVIVAVHFAIGNGYGFHRDELQFLDDARHLQWGFVAYPPMTAFCGRIAIALFGISPQVFRLPAAFVNAISLVIAGLIARELGGRRAAQIVTVVAAFPLMLAFSSVLQYNTFDLLAWSLIVFFVARLLRTGDERSWIGVGVGIGIGVLSKYSIAFPVASLLAGLVILPSQRRHLRSRWFWYGALTATIIAAPNLIWLASHQFITLTMEHFIHARDVRHGRADGYYTDQIKFTMFAFPLAVAGLVALLRSTRFRFLSVFYIGPFVLFAIAKGRGYYLMAAYPVLYAAGAVALEQGLGRLTSVPRVALRAVVLIALMVGSAAIAWAYLPMWKLGSAGWNWQMKNNSDMADEVGWPELVAQVAQVRDTLSPEERSRLAVLANNYGEAGAVALYGPQYGLPTPISSTNTFHMRGYGPYEPETVIVLGGELDDQLKNFESCRVAARVDIPYGVRNEESVYHPVILVCKQLRWPWAEVWARSQEFG